MFFLFCWFSYFYVVGSHSFATMGCSGCSSKTWCVGVPESECARSCCWGVATCWVPALQGRTCWRKVKKKRLWICVKAVYLFCYVTCTNYKHFSHFHCSSNGNFVLELDFEPFNAAFPRPTLNKSIGNGVQFLNRHLSAKLFHDKESLHPLLEFLRLHSVKGKVGVYFYSLN